MDNKQLDEFVDSIFAEAITAGDLNITKGNEIGGKGETFRQMLAGEFFGSSIWPYQHATSSDLNGSEALMQNQAARGLGDAVRTVVESVFDDPLSFYSDPQSVGFLVNTLQEFGYADQAKAIASLVEVKLEEKHVEQLSKMAEDLEKEGTHPFLFNQIRNLSETVKTMLSEEGGEDNHASTNPPNQDDSKEDDNPASADANVSTVTPEV